MNFSKYMGNRPLAETSIDDIPLDEQRAFFDERGWPWGGDFVPDEQDDELYGAWAEAQEGYQSAQLCQRVLDKYPDVVREQDGVWLWSFQDDDPAFYTPAILDPTIDYPCDDQMRDPRAVFASREDAVIMGELWIDLLDLEEMLP